MTTQKNSNKTESKITRSATQEYFDTVEQIRNKNGINLVLDPFAPEEFGFHRIYLSKPPVQEKGITYPEDFRWWREISREELPEVESKYFEITKTTSDSPYPETLHPIFNIDLPPKPKERLKILIRRILKLESRVEMTRGICIIPDPDDVFYEEYITSYELPKAFLPSKEMFSKSLQELKIEDILTILGPWEQKIYALTIGRALVGRDSTVHERTRREISHTWRTAPIITGMPGIGKSTITKKLIDAIKTTGYKVAEFSSLNKQFGIADIITADLAYADDMNDDTFKKYIDSPVIKSAITGAPLRTEKKFLDEVTTVPNAAFISNINDFNINATYGTDDGVLDRLKILNCRVPTEFDEVKTVLTGISKDSPNLHPVPHIKWLCKKLDCSQNALMLRFARLCVDLFLEEHDKDTLDKTINQATTKLDIQLHKHYDKVIAMVFQLSYILRRPSNFNEPLPDLKPALLEKCINAVNFLINDERSHWVREGIKQDWINNERPSYHPWTGVKLLDQLSVDTAAESVNSVASTYIEKDLDKAIKTIFGCLRLNQGYNVPANTAAIIRCWNTSNRQFNSLLALADKVRKSLDPETLEVLQSGTPAITSHIKEEDYDRQARADLINQNGVIPEPKPRPQGHARTANAKRVKKK